MDYYLEKIANIIIVILCFFVLLWFFFIQEVKLDYNYFDVKIGEISMNYFIKNTSYEILKANELYDYIDDRNSFKHNVAYLNDLNFNIKEFEIYDNSNLRVKDGTNALVIDDKAKLVNSNIKMKIERKSKLIYEGDVTSDLTKLITEPGRYYFHLYIDSKRSIITKVKTIITFDVEVLS